MKKDDALMQDPPPKYGIADADNTDLLTEAGAVRRRKQYQGQRSEGFYHIILKPQKKKKKQSHYDRLTQFFSTLISIAEMGFTIIDYHHSKTRVSDAEDIPSTLEGFSKIAKFNINRDNRYDAYFKVVMNYTILEEYRRHPTEISPLKQLDIVQFNDLTFYLF